MENKNTKLNPETYINRTIEIEITIADYYSCDLLEAINELNETLQPLAETYGFHGYDSEFEGDWYNRYFYLQTENEFDAIAKAYTPAWEFAEAIRTNVRIKSNPDHPLRIIARYLVTKYETNGEVLHDYFPFIVSTTNDR